MKRFLFGIFLGILLVVGVIWYYANERNDPTARNAMDQIETAAKETGDAAQNKLKSWGLTPEKIKEELDRTGKVIRSKAQDAGAVLADATADARITGAIKAKLVADMEMSALSISVNTTDGRVTLSGTASSAESIGKAIKLALETDGVREVISTLQVKKS